MSELSDYIRSAKALELYSPNERDNNLSFAYNLLSWVEKDGADKLEQTSAGFLLSKSGEVVGTYPIRVPVFTPPLLETLLKVFNKDEFVREYLGMTYEGDGVFTFIRK